MRHQMMLPLTRIQFECHILGLDIVVPHLRLEITVKDITNVEKIIENFIRDKLVKFLEDKVLRPLEDAAEDVEKVSSRANRRPKNTEAYDEPTGR